ncbi:hypothetical protein JMM81_21640 [Bacillus sp. V3B]|uniref:DUF294 nucleotidyltransferase-like domain-containing protein n=1 Tax=Bacillus sp. V3B TaxID=2804915 RepID=UPI002108CD24|nr:DUF294 nucleotidyltransferase-like domain-containing protein [Bacillus sp. V3B]MCQ6277467.1 hypothetical protein [Bacillus sp. V3B]
MVSNEFNSYDSIREWKEQHISEYLVDTFSLNQFHDAVMDKVFELSIIRLNKGVPPCRYCWFITGSGGRFEQGLISDQDHGIIFEIPNKENERYFLELGKEISYGLEVVGYPYCHGNIMSSNPLWCKSIDGWKGQLLAWMEKRSLESIRNLQIFYDARCLKGADDYVKSLKSFIYDFQQEHPVLIKRLMESVMYVKNSIGPIGQFIVEEHGKHRGSINLKYSAFIPYVNAIRILAIKEGLSETSTLDRLKILSQVKGYSKVLKMCTANFYILLGYRLLLEKVNSYEDTHFLKVKNLNRSEKRELKRILKEGKRLHQFVTKLIETGC